MSENGAIYRNGRELAGINQDPIQVVALSQKVICDSEGLNIKQNYKKKLDVSNPGLLDSTGYHNSMFRGKDITDRFKDGSLYADITSGAFTNLFIGDYFMVDILGQETKCYLAAFKTNIRTGSDNHLENKNCAVIVPDKTLLKCKWNLTDTTEGGYQASNARNELITKFDPEITEIFGDHLIEYKTAVSAAINTTTQGGDCGYNIGCTSGFGDYIPTKSELLTEKELYGTRIFSCSPINYCYKQLFWLPLFMLAPELLCVNSNQSQWNCYWLQDVSSVTHACVFYCQYNSNKPAGIIPEGFGVGSYEFGLRPKWLIG